MSPSSLCQPDASNGGVLIAHPDFNPGPIDAWFQEFKEFEYQPSAGINIIKEFRRLAAQKGWGEKQRVKQKLAFHQAVDAEFTMRVGKGVDLFDWQRLAKVIGIDPVPTSITQCRKIINQQHIYIYHIVHHYRRAQKVYDLDLIEPSPDIRRFDTVADLRKYAKKQKMFYPKNFAKGCALKGLLRPLL